MTQCSSNLRCRFAILTRLLYTSPHVPLGGYLDFKLIRLATQRIYWLIFLPFIAIFFMVVARSELFDAMDFPIPVQIVIGLALVYALNAQRILHKCAIDGKTKVLKDYEERLIALEARKNPEVPEGGDGATAGQIERLMDRIRETRTGAFLPFSQQPAVQASLLPLGGYGGTQLIEWLVSLPLLN